MAGRTPDKVTVLIDDREKFPILFPGYVRWFSDPHSPHLIHVLTEKRRLVVGDYLLHECPDGCVVERKGSAVELAGNLVTSDRRRAVAAFRRLCSRCRRPVLVCDFSISDLQRELRPGGLMPGLVISELMRLLSDLDIGLVMPGPCKGPNVRRDLGALLVHMMLAEMLEPHDEKEGKRCPA